MELVGRRFLCVSAGEESERGGVARWGWRAGLIRAVTSRHTDSPTLSVVEGGQTISQTEADEEREGVGGSPTNKSYSSVVDF
ncbi:hypothetical protein QTP86_021164, partial [Hemibagrus guttatus]